MLSSAPSGVQVLLGLVVPPGARRRMERARESGLGFLRLPGRTSHSLATSSSSFTSEAPCRAALEKTAERSTEPVARKDARGEVCAHLGSAVFCQCSQLPTLLEPRTSLHPEIGK
ncbi:hypothetical protein NDU88_005913 [Pleurodeles waltl]|uniref:Uncharacterized protein n=1 Tax=Pleurodeles waltl TaxID=8319 RepID=A0AAV7TWS0_PLEWA|nr:hypothetical protein NDU88_005913 [Pleurodeles waltl]